MSDLISQTDLLLSKCKIQDSFELSVIPSEDSNECSWCYQQAQMVNTASQHGFCLYAKDIDAIGSNIGFKSRVNLREEMLASSASAMAFGRLLEHDARARTSVDGKGLEMIPPKCELAVKREVKSCLFDIVTSIAPSRLYLALKGAAYHEYISSLRCISRSEASRLSAAGMGLTKRQRTRRARHYLSTSALTFSPEDISLLGQYNFNGKLSSNS